MPVSLCNSRPNGFTQSLRQSHATSTIDQELERDTLHLQIPSGSICNHIEHESRANRPVPSSRLSVTLNSIQHRPTSSVTRTSQHPGQTSMQSPDKPASSMTLMLVEDEPSLAMMVKYFLESNGFQVSIEPRGDLAIDRIITESPDVVVLDINLPGENGIEVCRRVRPRYDGIILMLTARGDESDEVKSFEAGADDYMAKPVRPRALLTRLQRHLKRGSFGQPVPPDSPMQVGTLLVDPSRRHVEIAGEVVKLTTAEFDLLVVLAAQAGHAISRTDIYQTIYGIPYDGLDRSIDLRISRLRKKLGDDPHNPTRVKSIRGVGYLLSSDQ